MDDYGDDMCLARYFERVAEHPEEFVNPPGDIYEILLDRDRIAHAQAEARRARARDGVTSADTRVGVIGEDPFLLVMRDAVRFADGSYGIYNRLIVPGGAAVLPMLGDRVVLLNRFRHGTRMWHLEAPRGAFSGGGSHEDEARRELVEEIGGNVTGMVDLGLLHSTSGIFNELHHLYMARVDGVGVPDKHEAIVEFCPLTIADMERRIADGDITDGPTLALFLRARLRGLL